MVAAVQPGIGRATIPRWAAPWLYPARYKSAAGGRGAGRTHTFSELCVLRMDGKLPAYEPGPVTIAAARQYQNSISESCKKAMEFYIRKLGLSDHFVVYTGIPQIKPPFLDIAPARIPPNIIPHSKGVKCGLMRPDSLKVPAFIGQPLYCQA